MKNLKDAKTKIFPSKTRGGKELPSRYVLDSPSTLSNLATPPHAVNPDMSQVIDDDTSSMNATHDDASTLLDDNVPLGEFLDEQIAKVRKHDIVKTDDELETKNLETPIRYVLPNILEDYAMDEETTRDFLACNYLKKLLCKLKEKSFNSRMK